MKRHLALAASVLLLGGPALAAEENIWSTTFETGEIESVGPFPSGGLIVSYGGASLQSAAGFPGMDTQMLRNDTGGTTSLNVVGLAAHSQLRLKFDLAFIDSWDSLDGACCAPDILFVDFGGQSYQWTVNHALGTVFDVGPGTVVSTAKNLGYNSAWTDTVVSYEFLFPHVASSFSLSIRFGGAGFQGGLDESWGIDNFALSAIFDPGGVIPEPATWAMLITGFGLMGGMARRRRLAAG